LLAVRFQRSVSCRVARVGAAAVDCGEPLDAAGGELMSAILKVELSLSAIAARQRLSKAEGNSHSFWLEHCGIAPSPELHAAWERERHLLETECDEARRFLEKCDTICRNGQRAVTSVCSR